jgi:hypothetical protein
VGVLSAGTPSGEFARDPRSHAVAGQIVVDAGTGKSFAIG